jgi:hypothetical protein
VVNTGERLSHASCRASCVVGLVTPAASRSRNRDAVTGQPQAYLRTFGRSRIRQREMADRGCARNLLAEDGLP